MPYAPGNQIISTNRKECKIWDVGTGKVIHTFSGLNEATASTLLGNVVAITENHNVKIFDLNESATDPARELAQNYQDMQEVCVVPSKIIVLSRFYVWATTKFEQ